jgi:hypothetical protein
MSQYVLFGTVLQNERGCVRFANVSLGLAKLG